MLRKPNGKVIAITCIIILVLFCLRIVPIGASPIPFIFASGKGMDINSDSGINYSVYFNDAGAAHSGNHWTWIVRDRYLFRTVEFSGFSDPGVRYSDLPVVQKDNEGQYLVFLNSRYGKISKRVRFE